MPTAVKASREAKVEVRLPNSEHARMVFVEFTPAARSIAHKVAKQYDWDKEELTDRAMQVLADVAMRTRDEHDPDVASLFTWVYGQIQWKLVNHCQFQKRRWRRHHGVVVEHDEEPTASRGGLLERLLLELSEEARALVQIVVEVPDELRRAFHYAQSDTQQARASFLQYLQRAGVDDDTIDSAWTEVQQALAHETLARS